MSDKSDFFEHPYLDPQEQIGKITNVNTKTIVSPFLYPSFPSEEHPTPREVILEVISQEVIPVSHDIVTGATNTIPSDDIPNMYELPLRSGREIPSNRYYIEFEAQWLRYSINKRNDETLSQSTVAFNTYFYSNIVPKNVREALWDPKWQKVMKEEISTLNKKRCI